MRPVGISPEIWDALVASTIEAGKSNQRTASFLFLLSAAVFALAVMVFVVRTFVTDHDSRESLAAACFICLAVVLVLAFSALLCKDVGDKYLAAPERHTLFSLVNGNKDDQLLKLLVSGGWENGGR